MRSVCWSVVVLCVVLPYIMCGYVVCVLECCGSVCCASVHSVWLCGLCAGVLCFAAESVLCWFFSVLTLSGV
jgi:hypothetical protein